MCFYYMLKDLIDPHLLCVVDICGSEESRNDPIVFATVAATIIPLENAIGGKVICFYCELNLPSYVLMFTLSGVFKNLFFG